MAGEGERDRAQGGIGRPKPPGAVFAILARMDPRPTSAAALLLAAAAAGAQDDPRTPPPPFAWEPDLGTAQAKAREDGRPVIAYFTFDACHWCKALQEDTFVDPRVEELGERFHWVYMNRDATPALPRRFNVSAYPGLLVLGLEGENVHRFHGYEKPREFLAELREGLRQYELYRAGDDGWAAPPVRDEPLTEACAFAAIDAPAQAVPSGIAVLDGRLLVAQGGALYERAEEGWRRRDDVGLRAGTQDLAVRPADEGGPRLYAVTSGWSKGDPILGIDPDSGEVVERVVTEANRGGRRQNTRGACWRDGALWVLGIFGRIARVDPATGTVARELDTGLRWTFGLTSDGEHLVCGSRAGLHWIDPQSGEVVRHLPTAYRLRAVGAGTTPAVPGRILVMEQPIFGHGPRHERVVVFPRQAKVYGLAPPER